MKLNWKLHACVVLALGCGSTAVMASDDKPEEVRHEQGSPAKACEGFGPQTPRDLDSRKGENKRVFTLAPSYKKMNLCNIHFHENAEHRAKDFSIYAGDGDGHGYESGYQCNMSRTLSQAELAPTAAPICKGEHGELKPGDTIEVHWVYSSCDIKPGKGLGSCLSASCSNPELRVETQVFTVVNDPKALNFNTLDYDGNVVDGYHQAKSLPGNTGKPIEFMGSTTGPGYSDQTCSPLHVTWSIRPKCAKVDINTVGKWCEQNAFGEDHAHGVRKLVVNPKLLSPIK
ncbi:MAG: cadmium carbonic anhydrase [Gammaproteobacteria bacterium]|nr:cadmium carbonic anhydrase [Gammaproteobacteria bacterium]